MQCKEDKNSFLQKGESQLKNGLYRYRRYGGGAEFQIYSKDLQELRKRENEINVKAFRKKLESKHDIWDRKYIQHDKCIPDIEIVKIAKNYGISVIS